ncbi:MAG: hypothetical protein WC776_05090, partial [Patescibacteria group bacterium]
TDEVVSKVCAEIGRSLLEPISHSSVEMQQSAEGCSLCLPPQMTEAEALSVWDEWMHSDDKGELKYGKWPLWLVGHLDLLVLHSWWAHWRLNPKWLPNHFTTVKQMTCCLCPSVCFFFFFFELEMKFTCKQQTNQK